MWYFKNSQVSWSDWWLQLLRAIHVVFLIQKETGYWLTQETIVPSMSDISLVCLSPYATRSKGTVRQKTKTQATLAVSDCHHQPSNTIFVMKYIIFHRQVTLLVTIWTRPTVEYISINTSILRKLLLAPGSYLHWRATSLGAPKNHLQSMTILSVPLTLQIYCLMRCLISAHSITHI